MIPRIRQAFGIRQTAALKPFWPFFKNIPTKSDIPSISDTELRRLKKLPRLTHTSTTLAGHEIQITDPYWFVQMYHEIFEKELYRFRAKTRSPLIVDCGANIGLSTIYLKILYPESRVAAFEPDPIVFKALSNNISSFQLEDVSILQKAVWTSDTVVAFEPDGSVGGRIAGTNPLRPTIEVDTVRLRNWLESPVDLLKIDIEGAEYEVLLDCEDRLSFVDCLFLEYHSKPTETQRLHEILLMLNRAGLRYHIQDANPICHPFVKEERHTYYDLQLNIFAFRD